jgi:hypothetical protein
MGLGDPGQPDRCQRRQDVRDPDGDRRREDAHQQGACHAQREELAPREAERAQFTESASLQVGLAGHGLPEHGGGRKGDQSREGPQGERLHGE